MTPTHPDTQAITEKQIGELEQARFDSECEGAAVHAVHHKALALFVEHGPALFVLARRGLAPADPFVLTQREANDALSALSARVEVLKEALKQIAIVDQDERPVTADEYPFDWRRRSEKQESIAREALKEGN